MQLHRIKIYANIFTLNIYYAVVVNFTKQIYLYIYHFVLLVEIHTVGILNDLFCPPILCTDCLNIDPELIAPCSGDIKTGLRRRDIFTWLWLQSRLFLFAAPTPICPCFMHAWVSWVPCRQTRSSCFHTFYSLFF